MSERILAPLVVFLVLAGSTAAFGIELFGQGRVDGSPSTMAVVTLPKVEVTGRRPSTAVKVAERAAESDCGRVTPPAAATHI